jgi:hypothetical protein
MNREEEEFTKIPQARLVSLPPRPVSVTFQRTMFNMYQGLRTGTAWAMSMMSRIPSEKVMPRSPWQEYSLNLLF